MASRRDNMYASLSRGRQLLSDRVEQLSERVDKELNTVGQRIDGAAGAYGYAPGLGHGEPSGSARHSSSASASASSASGAHSAPGRASGPHYTAHPHGAGYVDGASNRVDARDDDADVPPGYSRYNPGPPLPPGTVDAPPERAQANVNEALAAARRPVRPVFAPGQSDSSTTTTNANGGSARTVHSYYGAGGCAKVEYVYSSLLSP